MPTPKAPILAPTVALIALSIASPASSVGTSAAGHVAFAACTALLPEDTDVPTIGQDSLPRDIIETDRGLSAVQQTTLTNFVDRWTSQLASASNDRELDEARRMLTEPLRNMLASQAFYTAFSRVAIEKLQPIMDGTDPRRAQFALQIVRFLRTPESITELVKRMSSERVKDPLMRLTAAGLLAQALTNAVLVQAQFDTAIRHIETAAKAEDDEMVVQRAVEALGAIVRRKDARNLPGPPAATRNLARVAQINVLGSAMSRLPKTTDPRRLISMMEANYEIITMLRDEWVDEQTDAGRREFSIQLAPVLVGLLGQMQTSWPTMKKDEGVAAASARLVAQSETLLRSATDYVAKASSPGSTSSLASAWTKESPDQFSKELEKWKALTSQNPYR